MTDARAPLIEVFHSIQGEGRFVGEMMTFVRIATCPIRCLYCDTPDSYAASATVKLGDGASEPNPVTATRAVELACEAPGQSAFGSQDERPRRVSLTGGEPLVVPEFVAQVGAGLAERGIATHLETAALDADALDACVDQLAHVSADYKLPGTLQGEVDHAFAHLACVERAARALCTIDVKLVLTGGVSDAALEVALERLADWRRHIRLILQPVTPFGAVLEALPSARLEAAVRSALRRGFDTRVIPQVHKALAVE